MERPPPIDPSNSGRGPLIISVSWLLTSIAVALIATRFHVRVKVLESLGADDWVMLVAGVLLLASQACITKGYEWGLGKHDLDLTTEQLINILKWDWIATTPTILASVVARISITILLVRIFGNKTWFRIFLITFTMLSSIVAVVLIVVVWVQCTPVQALWNPTIPAKRWNASIQQDLAYLLQSMFTFSDLTYALIPCVIIWDLQLRLSSRIGLMLVMSLGLFTMAASIMKTITSQSHAKTADSEYNASDAVLWSAVEESLVIIMGCIPPLRAITKIQFHRLHSLSRSLVKILSSSRSNRSASSSKADGSSYNSHTWQQIEMQPAQKNVLGRHNVLIKGDSNQNITRSRPEGQFTHKTNICRVDDIEVSYDRGIP